MIVVPNFIFRSKDDFIKALVKESAMEFPNYISEDLKDLLFNFSEAVMKNILIEENANNKVIDINYGFIAQKVMSDIQIVYISSKIGLPVEYCYLAIAEEELNKKISDDKTLRSELKMLLKQASQDLITQFKLELP